MKIVIGVVISYLCFVEIIDSKLMRIQPVDELHSYTIDPSVPPFTEYANSTDFIFEQIDDENVQIGGYFLFMKSVDPKMPLHYEATTKYFQNSVWNDAFLRLTIPSMCPEFVNPNRFWYNITKLWIACPPQKGDKWPIESQIIDMRMTFPPSLPSGSWQAFVKAYQLGTIYKFGFMFQMDIIEIAKSIL